MKEEDFTIWLDGFLTAAGHTLTTEQVKVIKDKLDTVFNKVTPSYPNPYPYISYGNYNIPAVYASGISGLDNQYYKSVQMTTC